jgi:hypothetical protein
VVSGDIENYLEVPPWDKKRDTLVADSESVIKQTTETVIGF